MASSPIGLPGVAIAWAGLLVFGWLVLRARRGRGVEDRATARFSYRSFAGIALQGAAVGFVSVGAPRVTLPPGSAPALVDAAVVAVLMIGCNGLFAWASRTMGRNWSIVARTRGDHALVTAGPFALVRHPIYVAMFLMTLAFAVAFGHAARLWVAVPLFALGTWLRIREEERLLRDQFGRGYDDYAGRVSRFVPGLF